MQSSNPRWSCFVGLLIASLAGCGGAEKANHPAVAPAAGVVTYNGSPVAGATVMFVSEQARTSGWNLSGITDASGKFEIISKFAPGTDATGVPEGDYTVQITKYESAAVQTPKDMKEYEAQQKAQSSALGQPAVQNAPVEAKSAVPAKYTSDATSDLKVKIQKAGNTSIELKLTD